MSREIRALLMIAACTGMLMSGCKQKSKEDDAPAAAPVASVAPAPTATEPAPPDTIPPPVAPTPPPVVAAVKTESLKTCCAALHKEESTVTKDKGLYQTAAASCDAISKLVTAGTTKKASALTTLRAALKGGKLPAGCD